MAAPILTGSSGATCWITDHHAATPAQAADMATIPTSLAEDLVGELDGAREALGCSTAEILTAALSRTVARSIGDGTLIVDLDIEGTPRVAVPCITRRDLSGAELLAATRSGVTGSAGGRYPRADVRLGFGERAAASDTHVLAVQVRRDGDRALRVDWRFDTRSFDRYTVEELAEQFPLALIEVTSG
ncbi:polyketide synthase [Mycobacterium sp. NPDC003449]